MVQGKLMDREETVLKPSSLDYMLFCAPPPEQELSLGQIRSTSLRGKLRPLARKGASWEQPSTLGPNSLPGVKMQ